MSSWLSSESGTWSLHQKTVRLTQGLSFADISEIGWVEFDCNVWLCMNLCIHHVTKVFHSFGEIKDAHSGLLRLFCTFLLICTSFLKPWKPSSKLELCSDRKYVETELCSLICVSSPWRSFSERRRNRRVFCFPVPPCCLLQTHQRLSLSNREKGRRRGPWLTVESLDLRGQWQGEKLFVWVCQAYIWKCSLTQVSVDRHAMVQHRGAAEGGERTGIHLSGLVSCPERACSNSFCQNAVFSGGRGRANSSWVSNKSLDGDSAGLVSSRLMVLLLVESESAFSDLLYKDCVLQVCGSLKQSQLSG